MVEIIVYATKMCPYCHAAKKLLKRKGAAFREIDVTFDAEKRREMTKRAGGRSTVPQIFIGERHVGGFDDLSDLEEEGRLDELLKGQ